jgi:hypothetical protein
MRCRLRGKYWTIVRARLDRKLDGLCNADNRTITVRPSLTGERELEVFVHEMLHACHWDLSEETITETAQDLARVLFRLGYRKED